MSKKNHYYTIVQHSGCGFAGKPQFERGLEQVLVTLKKDIDKIIRVRGILFKDYMEADDYCMAEMYPESCKGLTPEAPGSFSNLKVQGLKVYIPKVRPKNEIVFDTA